MCFEGVYFQAAFQCNSRIENRAAVKVNLISFATFWGSKRVGGAAHGVK